MTFGGRWAGARPPELAGRLDASAIAALVDLDGGWGDALRREIARWRRRSPGGSPSSRGWTTRCGRSDADFGEKEAARLRAGVAAGARGLKVWKPLGLRARDPPGRLVAVDDPRLDPLWAAAGELGVPVTIHVADPIAFFDPLDAATSARRSSTEHPDWHFWPTRPPGRPDLAGFPPFDEIIDGLEAVVVRHPGTTFVGAHVGCVAGGPGAGRGDAGAAPQLARGPGGPDRRARAASRTRRATFFVRCADRVLFGTDMPPDPAWWAVYERFLETARRVVRLRAGTRTAAAAARGAGGSTAWACRRRSSASSTRATRAGSSSAI